MNGIGRNLGTVIRFEVSRTITKRRFWVLTLVVPVMVAIVFLLVSTSSSSTEHAASEQKNARFTFEYVDQSGLLDPSLAEKAGGTPVADAATGLADVKAGEVDAFFDYPAHPATDAIRIAAQDVGVFDNGRYDSVAQNLLQTSAAAKLGDPSLAKVVAGDISSVTTTYADGALAGGIAALLPPLMFLVLFYVVILLLGNQMLAATLEEKENRVTEMILTTIDATSLILGKIVSLFVVGIVQMLVFALPIVIGWLFFRDQLSLPDLDLSHLIFSPEPMIVGALILVGGFALFTGTLVAVGAVMPTARDAGPLFGVMMILIFVPFYAIALIVSDPSAPIVQFFTFFPYSATVTALLRNAFGSLPLGQAVVIIVELYVLAAIVLWLAVQLFKHGSIEYSRRVDIRAALRRARA